MKETKMDPEDNVVINSAVKTDGGVGGDEKQEITVVKQDNTTTTTTNSSNDNDNEKPCEMEPMERMKTGSSSSHQEEKKRESIELVVDDKDAEDKHATGRNNEDGDFESFHKNAKRCDDEINQQLQQQPQSKEEEARGQFVSPQDFELLRVIGMGSFGKVLQCRLKSSDTNGVTSNQVLAMKVISKRLLKKKESYIENINAERAILTKLSSHPFIVTMHCAFQTGDKLYIVMDYCAGGELFMWLGKNGVFLEKTASFYVAEIVLALEHLHSHNVLHRDLKPENILLGTDGHLRLTDFGLAKEVDQEKNLTVCGTQEYMAPEMIARVGYGKAADFWSLGCIAYEMLAGDPPFSSKKGAKDLFQKIMTERVKMPPYSTAAAHKLLKGLLNRNVSMRLGAAKGTMFQVGGVSQLKQLDFFTQHWKWDKLESKTEDPPQQFHIENEEDVQHFHSEFTGMVLPRSVTEMSTNPKYKPRHCNSQTFRGFSYIQPEFSLPERPKDQEHYYWNHMEEDGQSLSDCASDIFQDDNQTNTKPLEENNKENGEDKPKKKKKKKKKKQNVTSNQEPTNKDATSATANDSSKDPNMTEIKPNKEVIQNGKELQTANGVSTTTTSTEDDVVANTMESLDINKKTNPVADDSAKSVAEIVSNTSKLNSNANPWNKKPVLTTPVTSSATTPNRWNNVGVPTSRSSPLITPKVPAPKKVKEAEQWETVGTKPTNSKSTSAKPNSTAGTVNSDKKKQISSWNTVSTVNKKSSLGNHAKYKPNGRTNNSDNMHNITPQSKRMEASLPKTSSSSSDWRTHSIASTKNSSSSSDWRAHSIRPAKEQAWPSLSSSTTSKPVPTPQAAPSDAPRSVWASKVASSQNKRVPQMKSAWGR